MHSTKTLSSVLLLSLAACNHGDGSATGAVTPNGAPGSVYVVMETAAGSDALVQFQVAAVALERSDGSLTGNVLPAPEMVTFADPSGELDGLTLANVPTGDFRSLHFVVAPGSGVALYPDGRTVPVDTAVDLAVPIPIALEHSSSGRSWLCLGQNGSLPPVAGAANREWTPAMSGRADGCPLTVDGARIAVVQSANVLAQVGVVDDAALQIEFAPGCAFDDHPGRDDFLRRSTRGDDLSCDGELHRDGRFIASRVRRGGHSNDGPRLLGRITELRPAVTSFVLQVQAEARRGGCRLLPLPEDVLVDASTARIHASDHRRVVTFGDLSVGQLAKVEWSSRTPRVGNLELVVAREIEVTSGSVPMRPEWEGAVQSVDLISNTIVVVPRGNDPIIVLGQSLTSVDVHVGVGVPIERRERGGPGRSSIGLPDLLPGIDRIWWRGTVTSAAAIEASSVRVRRDD